MRKLWHYGRPLSVVRISVLPEVSQMGYRDRVVPYRLWRFCATSERPRRSKTKWVIITISLSVTHIYIYNIYIYITYILYIIYGQDGCAARESAFWLRRAKMFCEIPRAVRLGKRMTMFFPQFINIIIISSSIIINNSNIININNIGWSSQLNVKFNGGGECNIP